MGAPFARTFAAYPIIRLCFPRRHEGDLAACLMPSTMKKARALPRGCYPEIRANDPYLIRARARIRTSCRFPRANLTSIPQYFGLHVHGLFTLSRFPCLWLILSFKFGGYEVIKLVLEDLKWLKHSL